MLTKEQLVAHLCRKRFPEADAMYAVYKQSGELELPSMLGTNRSTKLSAEEILNRKARYEEIREYENWLNGKSYVKLQEEELKENTIEALSTLMIPAYSAVDPVRRRELNAMSVPGANGEIRTRASHIEDLTQILPQVEAMKNDLRLKDLAELKTLFNDTLDNQWRKGKHTIDAAAKLIAEKIHPGDEYPWIKEDRAECEQSYKKHLKSLVLSGGVSFYNPHRKTKFDHAHLSEERFPPDGLIARGELYLCLMSGDQGKGYFPIPPKPISKAPPPITPLEGNSIDLAYRYSFTKPDWAKWKLMDKAHLWKAVCLAADIEPPKDASGDLFEERQLKNFPKKFLLIWEVLNADNLFTRLEYVGTAGRMLYTIDLGWLALWAISKGITLPEPMIERAAEFDVKKAAPLNSASEATNVAIAKAKSPSAAAPASVETEPLQNSGDKKESALPSEKAEPERAVIRIKKAALLKKYKHEWPAAESDIGEASRNDLSKAQLGGGYYDELQAIAWAKERGKFEEKNLSPTPKASIFDSVTSSKNRLK